MTRHFHIVPGHFGLLAISVCTVVCWALTTPVASVTTIGAISQLLAALALIGFASLFFISTRHRWVDWLFDGLDKSYSTHKWLGIASVLLIGVHAGLVWHDRTRADYIEPSVFIGAIKMGVPGLVIMIILILIALIAKRMNYQKWKTVHVFLILPYTIGLVHYFRSSSYGGFNSNPFAVWMIMINLIGALSAFYSVFLYERIALRFRYRVTEVEVVANKTLRILGQAIGRSITHRPGQFAFLKFARRPHRFPSHPFTISGPVRDGLIEFTVKALGDHTSSLVESVVVGDQFVVSKSHGTFDYTKGGKHQIWIAGGIGITPFRSWYQTDLLAGRSIDFFYAYHGEDEAAFLSELTDFSHPNLRIHLVDDTKQGFLTMAMIAQQVKTTSPIEVFFCGPKPMRNALKKDLGSTSLTITRFHNEEFEWGR